MSHSRFNQVYIVSILSGFLVWGYLFVQAVQRSEVNTEMNAEVNINVDIQTVSVDKTSLPAQVRPPSPSSQESISSLDTTYIRSDNTGDDIPTAISQPADYAENDVILTQTTGQKGGSIPRVATRLDTFGDKYSHVEHSPEAAKPLSKAVKRAESDISLPDVFAKMTLKQALDAMPKTQDEQDLSYLILRLSQFSSSEQKTQIDSLLFDQILLSDAENSCRLVGHIQPVIDDYNEGLYYDLAERLPNSACSEKLKSQIKTR